MGLHIRFFSDWLFGQQPQRGECCCQHIESEQGVTWVMCAEHSHQRAGDFTYVFETQTQTTGDRYQATD